MTTSWVDAASERSGAISDALMAKARWLAQQCVVAGRIDMERLDEHQVVAYELAFAAAEREVFRRRSRWLCLGRHRRGDGCHCLRPISALDPVSLRGAGDGARGPGMAFGCEGSHRDHRRANSTEMTARCLDEIGERTAEAPSATT